MTVDSRPEHAATPAEGTSSQVRHARKLLAGGATGGAVATVLALVGFGIGYGTAGLLSAALAAAMVLFFYAGGQYVMVRFADAGARLLLSVALLSYTTRVLVLGLVLLVYQRHADALSALIPNVVFLTTVAVVVGWLVAEVWVFSRLRIAAYDADYQAPAGADDET
ncbi:hypothetical protein [uncultured Friedmanniella sp.]|uniref:hypothetical protein n=1 Tax=uncultured Friedmanniella sp. TaxID=335381 RepID=UPI0035CAEC70